MIQNSLQSTKGKPKFSIAIQSDMYRKLVNDTLGDPDRARRFVAAISSAVAVNPALQECDAGSILSAALLGEALNLSPSPQLGQYYLVPYNDKKKGKVAQFQIGYKGLIQLAVRSGYYSKLNVLPIKQGELIRYDPLTEDVVVKLIDDDDEREAAPTIGYYAMFEYAGGVFRKAIYWSRAKMERHADRYSQAFSMKAYKTLQAGQIPQEDMWKYSSFWYKDFDGMACKTMLRQLISKWGIMSVDLQDAVIKDSGVIHTDGTVDYIDTPSDELPATEQPIEAPVRVDITTGEVIAPATGNVPEDGDPLSFFDQ